MSEFRENDHPRDKAGRFAPTGEGGGFAAYRRACGGDHYRAAQAYYKQELQGTSATPSQGPLKGKKVHFIGGDDRKKFREDTHIDPVKAEALQYVKNVIETGKYVGSSPPYSGGGGGRFARFYHFQKTIPMWDEAGRQRKLIVDVGKTHAGKLEYIAHSFIHNHAPLYKGKVENLRRLGLQVEDTKKYAGRRLPDEVPIPTPTNPPGGLFGASGHRRPAFDKNLLPDGGEVNPAPLTEAEVKDFAAEIAADVFKDLRAALNAEGQRPELKAEPGGPLPRTGPFRFLSLIEI